MGDIATHMPTAAAVVAIRLGVHLATCTARHATIAEYLRPVQHGSTTSSTTTLVRTGSSVSVTVSVPSRAAADRTDATG